jgi:hypothetical protein
MAGLPNLEHLRFVAAADRDLLAMDGQWLPFPTVPGGAAVLGEPLDVEVLGVPAHVGEPPCVVGGPPDQDAR